jgi:hypothetical protein
MKTKKKKIKQRKVDSINFSLTFEGGDALKIVQTGIFPSPAVPTLKALLDLIVFSVNEECKTTFSVVQDKKQTLKELGYE